MVQIFQCKNEEDLFAHCIRRAASSTKQNKKLLLLSHPGIWNEVKKETEKETEKRNIWQQIGGRAKLNSWHHPFELPHIQKIDFEDDFIKPD